MTTDILQVAAAVVRDGNGRILITQRAKHAHQGGLWEFPGGKLEAGETPQQALIRELREEVGIEVKSAQPLIKVRHDYGDRRVLLDVWSVDDFDGVAWGCEGQALQWIAPQQLSDFAFPAANLPIIKAALLPSYYGILEGNSVEQVLARCQQFLQAGVSLIQLRLKSLPLESRQSLAQQVLTICQQHAVKVLLNSDLVLADFQGDGIHLSSQALQACQQRPAGLVGASCHNLDQLRLAEKLALDFAVLAPIQPTTTHPDANPLGWQQMQALIEQVNLPVYALGGLRLDDLDQALANGAQGLAGITTFLNER
ncbi:MAG: Nudix family hydrolase [Methylomonas sp.]